MQLDGTVSHLRRPRTAVIIASMVLLCWVTVSFVLPNQGPVDEYYDAQGDNFRVRVERRHDLLGPMHYWYIFRSNRKGEPAWQEVTRQLYGDRIPLPKSQIRFVGENVGYFFFALKYAVTIDAGKSWTVFDFEETPLFKPRENDYSKIADVQISQDGSGSLTMFRYDMTKGKVTMFVTSDYGQHWSLE